MSLIIDQVPEKVLIGDKEIAINTDFRVSILFELLMQDKELDAMSKTREALALYYPKIIPKELQSEALERALWFYTGGKELEDIKESKGSGRSQGKQYSFEHDDAYIYAAFKAQYGIDLQDEDLHWWKFKALFLGLNEECKISKIMSYRATLVTSEMSKSEQKFYRKMQSLYALPDTRTEEEKEADFADALSF